MYVGSLPQSNPIIAYPVAATNFAEICYYSGMKTLNIVLGILILIGLGLLATQSYWVDPLVEWILTFEGA